MYLQEVGVLDRIQSGLKLRVLRWVVEGDRFQCEDGLVVVNQVDPAVSLMGYLNQQESYLGPLTSGSLRIGENFINP